MIFALINSNVVENVVVCDTEELAIELLAATNQFVIRIDTLEPVPGIGYTYTEEDGFVPPPEEEEP